MRTSFPGHLRPQWSGVHEGESTSASPHRIGVRGVVDSKGDSFDNALAETINGLCKTEVTKKDGLTKPRKKTE